MKSLREVEGQTDARPYLQSSSYVEINPEAWRLAVDIQGESQDIFQTAYQIMASFTITLSIRNPLHQLILMETKPWSCEKGYVRTLPMQL